MYRSGGYEADLKTLSRLRPLGIRKETPVTEQELAEYLTEFCAFLESYDFMKLGQALQKAQWNSAMMTLRRMDLTMKRLQIDSFSKQVTGLRMAVSSKESIQAKQILSLMVAKRVQLLNVLKESERE